MPGQSPNIIFALVISGLLFSCSSPPEKEAPRFHPAQITRAGDGSGLSLDKQATRTWKDYDGDGLSDRKDFDIDDDGFPNLLDQYPFDEMQSGADSDLDLIPDFVDFDQNGRTDLGPIQLGLFRTFGLVVLDATGSFSEEEIRSMKHILEHPEVRKNLTFRELRIIARYTAKEQIDEANAEYDPFWKQISFFTTQELRSFRASFIHELGHVHAAENEPEFEVFKSGFRNWHSPSEYGSSSPEEGYAESFLYSIFLKGIFALDDSRFALRP